MTPAQLSRRILLQFQAVRLQCLDAQGKEFDKCASGFLTEEFGRHFLYTAWHVAAGFDPSDPDMTKGLPRQRYLRVRLQDSRPQGGAVVVGGEQEFDVPLYENPDSNVAPLQPTWLQSDHFVPNADLQHAGFHLPRAMHDVVKIEVQPKGHVSTSQLVDLVNEGPVGSIMPVPGDRLFVVGYPFGFSAAVQADQPTPIVLTRFVASIQIAGTRAGEILLDGLAAEGMSGGPVFLERDNALYLVGVYTGGLNPGGTKGERRAHFGLGTVAPLSFLIWGVVAWTRSPSVELAGHARI